MAKKPVVTRQPTRDLMVRIPEDVFKALRVHAVLNDRNVKDVVTEALRKYLKLEERREE